MAKHALFALFVLLAVIIWTVDGVRNRQMSSVEDEVYDIIVQICKGEFCVPVKERSQTQKAAYVRFWRNRNRFSIQEVNGEEKLFYDGKAVLKKSEVRDLVKNEYSHCKGIGSRKLIYRLHKQYQGVSELNIHRIIPSSRLNKKLNARFTNKAILRQIRTRAVQVRTEEGNVRTAKLSLN